MRERERKSEVNYELIFTNGEPLSHSKVTHNHQWFNYYKTLLTMNTAKISLIITNLIPAKQKPIATCYELFFHFSQKSIYHQKLIDILHLFLH